jgi:tetratricopeptide (TPR) repeat protein
MVRAPGGDSLSTSHAAGPYFGTSTMNRGNAARQALLEQARRLFETAYESQMGGDLDEAISLYQASIDIFPTAEAHTFLGWTYSIQGRLDDAIAECRTAIDLDPEFGNPYNDIGAYLIDQKRVDDAIPWLERALQASRYASFHFPWFNLGRAYAAKEHYGRAAECFTQALAMAPDYQAARDALTSVRLKVH